MKISIIIPVYNVADYLESCIKSCLDQSMARHEYEIIFIDDGSQDNCPAICRKYAKEYGNITFYHQAHSGQSIARNLGLAHATGEYIWFVDADDKIRPDSLDQLFKAASSNKLDILAFKGTEIIDGHFVPLVRHNQLANETMAGRDFLCFDYSSGVPLYIFRKEFLDNSCIRFMEGVHHEDEDFMIRALYECSRLGFLARVFYEITVRQGSITRSVNPKKAYDLIKISGSLSRYLNDKVDPAYKQMFQNRISILLNSVLLNAVRMNKRERSDFMPFLYLHGKLFKDMRKSQKTKYRLEGWLYCLSPKLLFYMYKVAKKW